MSHTNLRAAAYVSIWSTATGTPAPSMLAGYRDTRGPSRATRTAVRMGRTGASRRLS